MVQKSIDGLKRRKPQKQVITGKIKNRPVVVGAEENEEKNLKSRNKPVLIEEDIEGLGSIRSTQEEQEYDQDLKDFFEEVKDGDPTKLVELSEEDKASKKRRRREKPKSRRKKLRKVWLILGIVFALLGGFLVWAYMQGEDLLTRVTGSGNLWNFIVSDANTPLEVDPASGRTNVLVFGTSGYDMDSTNHDGGWLTDTLMLASLDQDSGEIKTVSLPRDLKVKTCTATGKINELYYCEYSKNDGSKESRMEREKLGAERIKAAVEEIFDLKIQYYVHVNWQALVQAVDAIGGIDVVFVYKGESWEGEETVIETTDKRGLADIYDRKCKCYLVKYDAHQAYRLTGEQALGVARARNDWGGYGAKQGNFSREQFQQKILQAVIKKAQKTNFAGDLVAALKIKDAIGDNLRMNFKDTEFKTIFNLAGKIDLAAMKSISIMENSKEQTLMTSGLLNAQTNQSCDTPGINYCYSYVWPALGVGKYDAIQKHVKRELLSGLGDEYAEIAVMNATTISGIGAKEKIKLEELGLGVTKPSNAPKELELEQKIYIYKLNDRDFPLTTKKLEEFYNEKIIEKVPSALQNLKEDFVIVIGDEDRR